MNRRIALFGKKGLTTHSRKVLGISRSNLLAYYPCNGNAKDYSGNGFNGAATAVTWGTGIGDGGKAATFAGTGYINIFSTAFAAVWNGAEGTSAMWCCVSAAGDWADSAWRNAFYAYVNANNNNNMGKRNTANLAYLARTGNAVTEAAQPTVGPITVYFHMAMTWSQAGDAVIYYINGSPTETDTVLGAWAGTISVALIGAQSTGLAQPWKGSIAHVGIWNTPLSGANIALLATV